jgi:hypothetical protein
MSPKIDGQQLLRPGAAIKSYHNVRRARDLHAKAACLNARQQQRQARTLTLRNLVAFAID